MTTINYNGNFNYRNKLLLALLILLVIIFMLSCSTPQSCLREHDAYKHKKQTQRELNYQFNRR